MSDIEDIISGVRGNTRYDFSTFGDPVKNFFDSSKQRADFDSRRAFRDGVPTDANGQPDFASMAKTLFQKGDLPQGLAASNLDVQRQQLRMGQEASSAMGGIEGGGPSIVSPPSSNRGASVAVAPPLNKGGASPQGPQGDQPGSIVGVVSSLLPDELAGPVIAQISAMTKTDPNAALSPEMSQRVQQVAQAAAQRMKGGPAPQPQAPQLQPQAQPQPQQMPAQAAPAPDLQKKAAFYTAIASNPAYPKSVQEAALTRLKAIQDTLQPTTEMKNAAASGKSLEDYQGLGDERTAQRDIMTKSLLPRIDASQEKANAARDDINSIHLAREQLDTSKGIFSGTLADKKLALGKVYSMLGGDNAQVTNTEAYGAAIGQRVASIVKAFGSGTAISDGDRKYAAAMAGGNISLDETSLRRILDIGERASRGKIDLHNQFVDKVVGSNEALKQARDSFLVPSPNKYKAPATTPGTSSIASKADYEKLPSGATFTGPDGKQWRKP